MSLALGTDGGAGFGGFTFDASGTFSERSAYDGEAAGFSFLSTNGAAGAGPPAVIYIKGSATSGDWEAAIPFQGPTGAMGATGATGPQGPEGDPGSNAQDWGVKFSTDSKSTPADDDIITAADPDNANPNLQAFGITFVNHWNNYIKPKADLAYVMPSAINVHTGVARTMALTDQNDVVEMTSASPNTFTIPDNSAVAMPVPSFVGVAWIGAGLTTIQAAPTVVLNGVLGGSCQIAERYGQATLYKRGVNEWVVGGNTGAVA